MLVHRGGEIQAVIERLTPASLAVELSGALCAASIPHAIGGAIALGFWSEPRGTYDLDINLFMAGDEAAKGIEAVERAGVVFSQFDPHRSALERGDARGYYEDMPVDLFFNSIPVHESARHRIVFVDLLGKTIPILSAEDIVVFKLLFDRAKDRTDIEILLGHKTDLDLDYVLACLRDTVGLDDHRADWWKRALAARSKGG
jgi:hypothetical protein